MAEFEKLTREAIDNTQANEPGTLVYRWQIDGSGSKVQLHERFTDEAAMMAHLTSDTVGRVFPQLMEASQVTRFDVHGEVSAEAAEALAGFGATIYGEWMGFDR